MNSHLFAETCRRLNEDGIIQLTFGAGSRFRSLIWQLLSTRTDSSPNPDSVFAHLLLSLFVEVDLAVVSASAKQVIVPDIIVAIQSYLDRNYSRNISLDDLSRIFSISKFHMSREFKRYVGKSPNDYLIGIRLDKAKVLLVDSRPLHRGDRPARGHTEHEPLPLPLQEPRGHHALGLPQAEGMKRAPVQLCTGALPCRQRRFVEARIMRFEAVA